MERELRTIPVLAAVARGKGEPFTIEKARIREPVEDEVLVRIVGTGMCHTDLIARDQIYPVPLPAVLGHEGAGVVEQIGPGVKSLRPGDHVVLTYGACGCCVQCNAGHGAYCTNFFSINCGGCDSHGHNAIEDECGNRLHDHFFAQSSFASLALAREGNAVKVDKNAPLELLGPLGCGIQTGAGAVINSLKVAVGSSLAVLGAGAVGLSAVMAARVVGATTIIAVDVVRSRLDLALELGATHVLHSGEVDIVEAIRQITGYGVDSALESTGRADVLARGVEALGNRGVLGVVGAPPLGTKAEFDINHLMIGGRSIRGIVEGDSVPRAFIPQLVDLYMQGRFPFDRLVKFYSPEEINQAAQDSSCGKTLKPILRFP
jgi:aryl-alcohol dehydrogenase